MKKERKAITIIKILLSLAFPALLCLAYCLIRGISPSDLYVPASYNNDCLYYYKLVDAVVAHGGPVGYFGFNESHALIGGFAAWSPLIVLPWSLWGLIFGWSYSSALICNVVIFSLSLAAFVYLSEIDIKELGILFLMLFLFPSFTIHLLNIMPEIIVVSIVLIYYGYVVRATKREIRNSYIVVMFVISAFLTIMRPYMALLMILPAYFLGRKKGKAAGFFAFLGTVLLSGVCNALIGHFFTSAYFEPLFKTDIFKMLLKGKFTESYYTAARVFKSMAVGLAEAVHDSFAYGLTMGTHYVIAAVTAVFAIVLLLRKEKKEDKPMYAAFAASVLGLVLAIVFLLQKTNEGGRHIFAFSVVGIVLVCLCGLDRMGIVIKSMILLLLITFCVRGAMVPTDYDIPVKTAEIAAEGEFWRNVFESEGLAEPGEKGYDNTVSWVFVDYDGNGNMLVTRYSELYELPSGVGISCCYPDYIINNIGSLKSRYVVTASDGKVADLLRENGIEAVAEHGNVVMFKRY